MTQQIVIKLNEKKFKGIMEFLKARSVAKCYSELAGICIWICYRYGKEKIPELGNKTVSEFIAEKKGMNEVEYSMFLIQKYNDFVGHKKKK